MNLIFSIIINGYSGVFLRLLVKILFDFVENILKRYDVQDIPKAIFRSLAIGLLFESIYYIAQQFPSEKTAFTFLVLYFRLLLRMLKQFEITFEELTSKLEDSED